MTTRLTGSQDTLRLAGFAPAMPIASGAEGDVFTLGDGTVAKVWNARSGVELERLQRFTAAVGRAGLPFSTPEILRIVPAADRWISVERHLPGLPLLADQPGISPDLSDRAVGSLLDLASALATVAPTDPLFELPALDEAESTFAPGTPFAEGLAALVRRRTERFRSVLGRALPAIDEVCAATVAALREPGAVSPSAPDALVHGDLIPANILVDDALRPTAVLDFGFLSTAGDPAFEAAVTASITDMDGPGASHTEERLDAAFSCRFGHDPHRLAVYRAAYALCTSNAFGADGTDGHFAWAMRMLRRPDILAALGLNGAESTSRGVGAAHRMRGR